MSVFGKLLRQWRTRRRFSQLQLAHASEASPRHISFLESGRAQPSRDMVLRLADALDLPPTVTNNALLAAGFAPHYLMLAHDDPQLEPFRQALNVMLSHHDPWPAIVFGRDWIMRDANAAAIRMFGSIGAGIGTDLIELTTQLAPPNGAIANWSEMSAIISAFIKNEIAYLGGDANLQERVDRLDKQRRALVQETSDDLDMGPVAPVVPIELQYGDLRLSLFTMLASFGTAQEVGLSDLRVELYFPSDEVTRQWLEAAAATSD